MYPSLTQCSLLFGVLAIITQRVKADNSTTWTFTGLAHISFVPKFTDNQNIRLALKFRTRQPNGLLFYHYLINYDSKELPLLKSYELFAELRQGYVRVGNNFNQFSDVIPIGSALNNDKWHTLDIKLNSESGKLTVKLDKKKQAKILEAFQRGGAEDLLRWSQIQSQITYGGTSVQSRNEFFYFVGCLSDIQYSLEDGILMNAPIDDVIGASEGCSDLCKGDNPCKNGGQCVNLYTSTRCDCFGTQYEGNLCNKKGATIMTFRGYEWVTYQLYEKKEDRLVADKSRISFEFKTERISGVLLYAVGGTPYHSHVTASLHAGVLHVSIAIADTDLEFTLGLNLDNGRWHNVTIVHSLRDVEVFLDGDRHHKVINGSQYFMTLDPKVYFGGGHNFVETRGLRVTQSFVGCMRNIYFNDFSVLYGLRKGNMQCTYYGGPSAEFKCDPTQEIPITFPTASSLLRHNSLMQQNLTISLKFKTVRTNALIFYVELISKKEDNGGYDFGFIEVWVKNGLPLLYFSPSDNPSHTQNLTLPSLVNNGQWHMLKLTLRDSKAKINVDDTTRTTTRYRQTLTQRGKVVLGYGLRGYKNTDGFVGCMKAIKIQGEKLDPINIIDSSSAVGIKLDGCFMKDHCAINNICEHGSECLSDWEGVQCSCPENYEGKACHFSKYPRNCDSYFQTGRNESGVYLIDLDGSGNLDPVYVQCHMNKVHGSHMYGETVIDHNFLENTTIRSSDMPDVRYHLAYRGMDTEHLRTLTLFSSDCQQSLEYRCKKAPILLGKKTWFQAANGEIVDYIGSDKSGYCDCDDKKTCDRKRCYCDHGHDRWKMDSGWNRIKKQLPLVDITVLQNQKDYFEGEATLTLGPLQCWGNVDIPLDKSVTITQEGSFIRLRPWVRGNLRFSFKTHQSQALLLYQNYTSDNPNRFSIKIINSHQVTFYFYVNHEHISQTLYTRKVLDGDEWHLIDLESDPYNIRITLDETQELVDLSSTSGVELKFDGMLLVGGIPEIMAEKLGETTPGFTGCIRGILYNGHFNDLEKQIDISAGGVSVGCMSSCWPNPCANGGTCEESWGSYRCKCKEQWSHHGINCEHDINQDAVTFSGVLADESYLLYDMLAHPEILTKTIVLSFRTFQSEALLLYAHDHLNNFVQLSLTDSNTISIAFNTYKTIIKDSITLQDKTLNDGQWKQVIAEDFYNFTRLSILNESRVIQVNRYRLDVYESRPFMSSQESEDVFIHRPQKEPAPFVKLYVGGILDGVSFLPPLKGCIRGVKMADVIINLGEKAREKGNSSAVYPECEAGCHENACFKNGYCEEQWKDSQFKCDCTESEFAGQRCEIEPCVNIKGNTFVMSNFTLQPSNLHTRSEQLSLTFKTSQVKTGDSDLMAMIYVKSSQSKDYVIVWYEPGMSERGSVVVETNQAFGIYRMKVTGKFADGRLHEMIYKREVSEMYLTVTPIDKNGFRIIDGIKEAKFGFPDYSLDDIDTIYIGGVDDASDVSGIRYKLVNFTGTISNVVFKPKSDNDEKITPLKALYNKKNGTYVYGDPLGPCSGSLLTKAFITPPPQVTKVATRQYEILTMPPNDLGTVKMDIIGNRIMPTTTSTTTTTTPPPITNLTAPVLESRMADDLTVAIAVSIIAALLIIAIIIALLLCRQRKRQEYDIKKEHEMEMKQPLNLNHYAPQPSPVPPDHLAKLDEFSMVSATLGPRPAKRVPPPEVPNRFSQGSFPLVDEDFPNVIYSRKKKRPASSISEVLEEMERRQKAKEQGIDPDAESPLTCDNRNHGEGELDWDPTADTTPLTCKPDDDEKSPDDSTHQTSTEYNGDSGYEAESRPENTEEDATPDSTVDIHTPPKMYMYDLTSLDLHDSPSLNDPSRRLLASELET